MDQNISLLRPDGFYLRGLAESLATVRRVAIDRAPDSDELTIAMVKRVVRAWCDPTLESWCGGFVLDLVDGRRLYVESCEDYEMGPNWDVRLAPMGADQELPGVTSRHLSNRVGWCTSFPEIDEYLRWLSR